MRTPLRVLIVEDNDDDAQLVLVRLRRAGYEPAYVRVDSEDSLLKALQRLDWQIVISDYAMPSFSGLKALHILREHDPNIPFILVSGTVGFGEDLKKQIPSASAKKVQGQSCLQADPLRELLEERLILVGPVSGAVAGRPQGM